MSKPKNCLHASYFHDVTREWHGNGNISSSNLVYPIFISDEDDGKDEILSLPNQYRWSVNKLSELIEPLIKKGLKSVLIFGVFTKYNKYKLKDEYGSIAFNNKSPVILGLKYLKKHYPNLLLITDLCLCSYTIHGHCGILNKSGYIDINKSVKQLSKLALLYAKNGANIIAPSDMIDGRIKGIKDILFKNGFQNMVSVMSYSSKYCSSFYGPFRDACHSAPKSNDNSVVCSMKNRSTYQLPIISRDLGIRASLRDINEGCDYIMVKPGGPYMDIIRDLKNECKYIPIAVYQVSGEYALLYHASKANAINLKDAVMETLHGFIRAGASIIITYYTPNILNWINQKNAKL